MVKKTKKVAKERFEWPFGPRNYLIFGLGIIVIIIGYIFLASGSITLAPILLVLGYCIIVPIAIIVNAKKKTPPAEQEETGNRTT
jgi:hypothetical protein